MISHSSGPNQIAVTDSFSTYVDGVVGRAMPRCPATADTAGPAGSTFRSAIATNGRGVISTPSGRASSSSDHAASGARRVSVSAVTAGSFGVDEDGSVISTGTSVSRDGHVHRLPDAGPAGLDQGEGEASGPAPRCGSWR